jgi:hypothetical protein
MTLLQALLFAALRADQAEQRRFFAALPLIMVKAHGGAEVLTISTC